MLLECENVSFAYAGETVVENIRFSVNAGDYICVVGENGTGKSTLLKGILGLLPCARGRVCFGDLSRTQIGYLPQQTVLQTEFPASVMEVVLSGFVAKRGLRPFYSKAQKQAAVENMALLGINGLQRRCYGELSGGQRQRVLLARALCPAEKLLLLDEPVTGLDPLATAEFYDCIKKINHTRGMAVLMVSHDMENAMKYASHILHLKKEQLFFGTAADYAKTELCRSFTGGR